MHKHSLLFLGLVLGLPISIWGQGPLYVSNGAGHQILKVDGTTGATTVLFTDRSATPMDPEGIVVGPDGRIWIADPTNGRIDLMGQDGSNLQGVYSGTPTVSPQGPSFDGAGNLFFNSKGATPSGVFIIVAATEFGSNPHCCVVGNILTPGQPNMGMFQGEATALDQNGDLLIVDRSGNRVLKGSPPFSPNQASASVLILDRSLMAPVGIGVDSANRVLVANHDAHNIVRFDSSGAWQGTYVTFSRTDYPYYVQFDPSDNLYVVTADSTVAANGKVWKVAPCAILPCTATLLVDLGMAFTNGTIPNLASGGAIGITLPIALPAAPAPQRLTAGSAATFDFLTYSAAFTYPAGASIPAGTTIRAIATPLLPADFAAMRLANSAFADAQGVSVSPNPVLPPNPIVGFRTQCFNAGSLVACPTTGGYNPTSMIGHNQADILVQITLPPSPVTPLQNPALLEAHDNLNNWMNIFTAATLSPPNASGLYTQTITGGTGAFTSDFAATQGAFSPAGTTCSGEPGHQILPPINADGSSVFKKGSTVPAKFRVCLPSDLNASIGPRSTVPTVVAAFQLIQVTSGTPSSTAETVTSTTSDSAFRWDPTNHRWIFNISTNNLTANNTYVFLVTLSDGSTIQFQFGLN